MCEPAGLHGVPPWFSPDADVHGHPYTCANLRTGGTPCGARMRRVAVGDCWELAPAPGEPGWEEITWVSPSWSTYDRGLLERIRRELRRPPLPPGPVTNFDIPGFDPNHYPTTRRHRFACPDPGAPAPGWEPCPECCAMPMRLAPRGWVCRVDSGHVHLFD